MKFPIKQICVNSALLTGGTAMICMVTGLLTVMEVVPEQLAGAVARLITLLLILPVALRLARRSVKTRMQVCLCLGVIYLAMCFAVGSLLGHEVQVDIWPGLVLAVCALAGVLASMKKQYRR